MPRNRGKKHGTFREWEVVYYLWNTELEKDGLGTGVGGASAREKEAFIREAKGSHCQKHQVSY